MMVVVEGVVVDDLNTGWDMHQLQGHGDSQSKRKVVQDTTAASREMKRALRGSERMSHCET